MLYPVTYSQGSPVPAGKPFYLDIIISGCSLLSYIMAAVHYFFITVGLLKVPLSISGVHEDACRKIRHIWCTRITRRVVSLLVRSPFRVDTLSLVSFTDQLPAGTGCVIVTCHTPWKRLIVQWCLEHEAALIVSNGTWTHRKRLIQKQAAGVADVRSIVQFLQQNGRVIIAADVFNRLKDCPVKFFDHDQNASLFPIRLARIAKVPVIAAVPVLRNGLVEIDYGPQFEHNLAQPDEQHVMQQFISFFEDEIKKEPGIYPALFK